MSQSLPVFDEQLSDPFSLSVMVPTLVAGRATGLEWRVHMKNQCDRNIPVERHCTSIRMTLITDESMYPIY